MKDEKESPKKWRDKSISLHPLSFDEALGKLLSAKPEKLLKKKKARGKKQPPA